MKTHNTIADWRVLIVDQFERMSRGKGLMSARYGMCFNLGAAFGRDVLAVKITKDLAETWPRYSGHKTFPIPSYRVGMSALDAFAGTVKEDMYNPNHPYGALRLELAAHCAKVVAAMTDEELAGYFR